MPPSKKDDCFIIMPISDPEGYNQGHFRKVYEDIIKIACEKAGFNPVRADDVTQTNLIHLDILQKLIHSPMAICDLSNRNPNVLFELGLRQAFDKPTLIIQECGTAKIFDIAPLRITDYRKDLIYREVLEDQESIAEAIKTTFESASKGEGINSIISLLSLSNPATLKETSTNDAGKMMQIMLSEINELKSEFRRNGRNLNEQNGFTFNNRGDVPSSQGSRIRIELRKLRDLTLNGAPIEIVKNQYDLLQDRILRYLNSSNHEEQHDYFKSALQEGELIFSQYLSQKRLTDNAK